MSTQQWVTVLGSTGSIGTSTLDVIALHPERFRVFALTAHRSRETLLAQCLTFQPRIAVLNAAEDGDWLRNELQTAGVDTLVETGVEAHNAAASDPCVDVVMAAIVGAAGLLPALAAAQSGKRVLLANKEALVMSGALFMQAVEKSGATLLPIDSEHNAMFQCLPNQHRGGLAQYGVTQLLLTASGGPFRGWQHDALASVTPDQACAHPNWSMGRKISVDSATLMNKGLELIEACWLFDATPQQICVVVHPQSVIHSMVAYQDGSVLAQLGNPDMRTSIAYGLGWPERLDANVQVLDLFQVARLDFEPPDEGCFPCLKLARDAMQTGGTAPTILNASNEVAVAAFLEHGLAFTGIGDVVAAVLDQASVSDVDCLETVLEADLYARKLAQQYLAQRLGKWVC